MFRLSIVAFDSHKMSLSEQRYVVFEFRPFSYEFEIVHPSQILEPEYGFPVFL